jgi:hypothetical protein
MQPARKTESYIFDLKILLYIFPPIHSSENEQSIWFLRFIGTAVDLISFAVPYIVPWYTYEPWHNPYTLAKIKTKTNFLLILESNRSNFV